MLIVDYNKSINPYLWSLLRFMNNDPELDGKYLGQITKDFVTVSDSLKEASYQVRTKGFSDYPIFPICKTPIPLGQVLIQKEEMALNWDINISYAEDFIQKELISNVDSFNEAYKNPDEFCCLFVIDGDFNNFVFLPYPED